MCNNLEVAGETSLSVLRKIHELYGVIHNAAFPNLVLEALGAAVKVVGTIIYRKRVLYAVKGELTLCDAVGVTAGDFSGAGAIGHIIHGVGISKHHFSKFSGFVRNHD